MMRKLFILIFLAVWSAQIIADDSVALNPNIDLAINGSTNISFPLNVVESSEGATPTEEAPAEVFVPMNGSSSQADYFTVKGVTTLFAASGGATINFPLYVNVGATTKYLYVAIKGTTGNYKIAQRHSSSFTRQTNVDVTFPVTSQAICDQATDCTEFAGSSSTEKAYFAYFFFSNEAALSNGVELETPETTYPGGIFFKINMSNRIYTASQIIPTITEIRPGEGRLVVKYTSTTSILKPKAVRVLFRPTPVVVTTQSPIKAYYTGEATAVLHPTEFAYSYEGEITVTNLENGNEQSLSVLFEDKYKFGTVLSLSDSETPLKIQQLLEKNACFLLTAGFGEDHYIIDYFRQFRDNFLSKSYLGRGFIHFYYELAPKYALILYQHDGLRAFVRGGAYVLYFIFNYIYLLSFGLFAICGGLFYRKRLMTRQTL